MSSERWSVLSDWHNQWLEADPGQRDDLRRAFAAAQPHLIAEADELAQASAGLHGFLETPAWRLAARALADDNPLLLPETMVGPYRIGGLLARGGMGDVYRATDLRLQRDVALKLLTQTEGRDPQRVERFLLEGRVTASLDHPNVVRLYDVGVFEGRPFLVTEFLEGGTLRAWIDRGPLAHREARRIAEDVARGLAAAHDARLVHRDLKPENIFITRAGQTKLLDFGIAKLMRDTAVRGGQSTETGVLFGTAGYLAPEQVRGATVDGRADLFALGSILFEMLTAQRAFAHEHTIDTLHAIVHDAPPDLRNQNPAVPAALAAIVMRLLEKAPADRFQTAADLAWALEQSEQPTIDAAAIRGHQLSGTPKPASWRPWFPLAAAATAVVLGYAAWRAAGPAQPAPEPGLTRFTWSLPAGLNLTSAPVISPDGRRIVFAGADRAGGKLFVRRLDSLDTTAIAGTEGGKQPFWSPDNQSIGFFARGKLMKIAMADGGPVEAATRLDLTRGENSHRWPVFLPDGMHFLYFNRSSDDERRGIYVGRIDRPAAMPDLPLVRSEAEGVFAPAPRAAEPDLLFYASNGRIVAQRFDAARLALVGDARTLDVAVGGNTPYNPAMLSVSTDAVAFAGHPIPFGYRLTSVARTGSELQISKDREAQNWPRLSPDGSHLARQRIDAVRGNPDIWVDDLIRGTHVRVTTSPDNDILPVWSPDGLQLAYLSGRAEARHLSIAAADGTGVVRDLPCPGRYCEPTEWSPDGKRLVVNVRDDQGGHVWILPIDPGQPATPLLAERFTERDARFSRDGRWVAYVSEETGRPEVSVQSLSGPPHRFVISAGGGDQPVWRRDGAELFFVDPAGRLQSVAVHPAGNGGKAFGEPVALDIPSVGTGHGGTQYDVSPDGSHMFFLQGEPEQTRDEVGVITGWRALTR